MGADPLVLKVVGQNTSIRKTPYNCRKCGVPKKGHVCAAKK